MADPFSALGAASAIVSFLDFSIKLTSGAWEIYKSIDGNTIENAHIDIITADLLTAYQSLIFPAPESDNLSENEHALRQLAEKCHAKCRKLIEITAELRPSTKSKGEILRKAWKARMRKGDITSIYAELRDYRHSITERLGQLQADLNKSRFEELKKILESGVDADNIVTSRITEQLLFASLHNRESGIKTPATDTFDWILAADEASLKYDGVPGKFVEEQRSARSLFRSQYQAWLGTDTTQPPSSSILHISGKAGCGKSTLMRHLLRSKFTEHHLQEWAGSRKLICVSFYFWMAAGDAMQTSTEGLYRTILFKTLKLYPELAPHLFPGQWAQLHKNIQTVGHQEKSNVDATLFHKEALAEAMQRLIANDADSRGPYALVMFIDGLDELQETDLSWVSAASAHKTSQSYSHSHRDVMEKIIQWGQSEHVKVCTSARPYTDFLDVLDQARLPVLHLHTTTIVDIYRCAKEMFETDFYAKEFDHSAYLDLCSQIAERSRGVFVWAILAARVMTKSLSLGDSKSMQQVKLDAIPAELNKLYGVLLSQVDATDQPKSEQILSLVLNRPNVVDENNRSDRSMHVPLYWLSWLDELTTDPGFPYVGSLPEPYTAQIISQRCAISRRLLSELTRGIVEVVYLDTEFKKNSGNNMVLEFFHRTALDYVKGRLSQQTPSPTSSDCENGDIYGRLCVADFIYISRDLGSAVSRILATRDGYKTLQRLGDFIDTSMGGRGFKSCSCGNVMLPGSDYPAKLSTPRRKQTPEPRTQYPLEVSFAAYAMTAVSRYFSHVLNAQAWHGADWEPEAICRMSYKHMSPTERLSFVLLTWFRHDGIRYMPTSTEPFLKADDFVSYARACNPQLNGLQCPPWMALLAVALVKLNYADIKLFCEKVVPAEAQASTNITMSTGSAVSLDNVMTDPDCVGSFVDYDNDGSLIGSIDYGDYHLSGDFPFSIAWVPRSGGEEVCDDGVICRVCKREEERKKEADKEAERKAKQEREREGRREELPKREEKRKEKEKQVQILAVELRDKLKLIGVRAKINLNWSLMD